MKPTMQTNPDDKVLLKIKYPLLVLGISAFIGFLFLSVESVPGHKELKSALIKRLVKDKPLPANLDASPLEININSVIYILGGSQDSLESRFIPASKLYHRGLARKILILSNTSFTMYSSALGRNLTYDGWAIMQLAALDVKKEDIEPVLLEDDFFGTLAEAKGVSLVATKRGYNHLILVSSSYHTMRVWESFSKFLREHNLKLYVYMSQEDVSLYDLLKEYFKLLVYKNFLL